MPAKLHSMRRQIRVFLTLFLSEGLRASRPFLHHAEHSRNVSEGSAKTPLFSIRIQFLNDIQLVGMSGSLEKSFAILEYLAEHPDGAALATIADELNQLRSGC